jgi:hypothetical protein
MDTKLLVFALAVITLTGCQHPMGLSKAEWQAVAAVKERGLEAASISSHQKISNT